MTRAAPSIAPTSARLPGWGSLSCCSYTVLRTRRRRCTGHQLGWEFPCRAPWGLHTAIRKRSLWDPMRMLGSFAAKGVCHQEIVFAKVLLPESVPTGASGHQQTTRPLANNQPTSKQPTGEILTFLKVARFSLSPTWRDSYFPQTGEIVAFPKARFSLFSNWRDSTFPKLVRF